MRSRLRPARQGSTDVDLTHARILILTTFEIDGYVFEALRSGASDILALVATGLSNDNIAGHLTLNLHTVKTHINRTMTKVGARDRAQLVVIAYETGLVRPPPPDERRRAGPGAAATTTAAFGAVMVVAALVMVLGPNLHQQSSSAVVRAAGLPSTGDTWTIL